MLIPLLVAGCVFGQYPDARPDELPMVIVTTAGEKFHGFPTKEGWREQNMVVIAIDAPWISLGGLTEQKPIFSSLIDFRETYRERAAAWDKRHREGWEAEGFENTGTGERGYWVAKTEADWARRAQKMEDENAVVESDQVADGASGALGNGGASTDTASSGGWLKQWGMHVVVVVLGGGLFLLVTFKLLL